jgi:hypothetical protein
LQKVRYSVLKVMEWASINTLIINKVWQKGK